LGDGEEHIRPFGVIVSAPVCCVFSRSRERSAAEDKGSFLGEDLEQAGVCGIEDLVAVEVVDVVFGDAVDVCCVGRDGLDGEVVAWLDVVDYVGGGG